MTFNIKIVDFLQQLSHFECLIKKADFIIHVLTLMPKHCGV